MFWLCLTPICLSVCMCLCQNKYDRFKSTSTPNLSTHTLTIMFPFKPYTLTIHSYRHRKLARFGTPDLYLIARICLLSKGAKRRREKWNEMKLWLLFLLVLFESLLFSASTLFYTVPCVLYSVCFMILWLQKEEREAKWGRKHFRASFLYLTVRPFYSLAIQFEWSHLLSHHLHTQWVMNIISYSCS